uniref:Rhodanese domain-containing protein n=2 Tax=Acrobeloides nanus TaxID=290746 RepID=A0A914C453_9BILA
MGRRKRSEAPDISSPKAMRYCGGAHFIPVGFPNLPAPPYSPGSYSTVEDDKFHPEYEDPNDYYYEKPPEVRASSFDSGTQKSHKSLKKQITPPILPPPVNHASLQRLAVKSDKTKKASRSRCGTKFYILISILILVSLLLACSLIALLWHNRFRYTSPLMTHFVLESTKADMKASFDKNSSNLDSTEKFSKNPEPVINASLLLTLLVTKRKVCIFEVATDQDEESRTAFRGEHIEAARLIFFANLSHSGVPVHPLQFQRYAKNLGIDTDCHVVLYDRGQNVWASYAYWIFRLFGHEKASILNGGFPEWKRLQTRPNSSYRTEAGPGPYVERIGNFRASWKTEFIMTFDDVVTNFDTKEYDVIDAQTREEYDGLLDGAIFGHIRTAINIPPEELLNFENNTWLLPEQQTEIFHQHGVNLSRPVLVYCDIFKRFRNAVETHFETASGQPKRRCAIFETLACALWDLANKLTIRLAGCDRGMR